MWGWIIGGVLGCVVLISYLQHRAQRGTFRPLSSRQPERHTTRDKPLGMEAIDMDHVNRVSRRNESLERSHTNWTRAGKRGSFTASADTDIQPLADDETYAKRFREIYMNKKDT